MSSHWLPCAQHDHTKIYLTHAEGRRHFCTTQWHEILLSPGSMSRISPHPIGSHQHPKQSSPHHLENINTSRYPLDLLKHLHISRNLAGVLKDFPFAIAYLDNITIFCVGLSFCCILDSGNDSLIQNMFAKDKLSSSLSSSSGLRTTKQQCPYMGCYANLGMPTGHWGCCNCC